MEELMEDLSAFVEFADLDDEVIIPPTEDELPYSDGMPMESERHALQLELLKEALQYHWLDRDDAYVAGNMGVYYSLEQARKQNFRAPDIFVALGVSKRTRKSWVVWQEEKAPDLVIELLSDSTEAADRGIKKQIYQDNMRVPEYILYSVETGVLEAFRLGGGNGNGSRSYYDVVLDEQNRFMSVQLDVGLMVWEGAYRGVWGLWLRWFEKRSGTLLPTGIEIGESERQKAESERQKAESERQKAEAATQRAERLATQLRALGITPDE